MWTLQCDGDLFGGKSIWLRPGSLLIFGRTKPASNDSSNEQSWVITHKSVSRKHLVIDVRNVEAGSADDLRSRTDIRLIDNSKLGTTLDGQKFKDANVSLTKSEHAVQLGSWEQKFFIKWQPVVLTPSMLTTKQKKASDPLASYRERVESLGIKMCPDYIVGQTTHVVANKRNSARNLQALINGQHVVTEAFIEAVVRAATPTSRGGDVDAPLQAPLEEDFTANWPNPLDYVPAPGKEPVQRPPEAYAPDPRRVDMFSGHTVVFFEQTQLDTLQDVINNGGGKAVLYDVRADDTDIKAFANYIHKLRPRKAIIVRFRGGEGEEQWKINFQQESQLALSQRSIDQNEFLDAIIMADINALKQPLQEDIEISSSFPSPQSQPATKHSRTAQDHTNESVKISSSALQPEDNLGPSAQDTPSRGTVSARRKVYRAPYKSRFAAFDEFDPSQITKYTEDSDDEEAAPIMAPIDDEDGPSVSQAVQHPVGAASTRKRPLEATATSTAPVSTGHVLDKVTSAHERYKRRKMADSGMADSDGVPQDRVPPKPRNAVVEAMENLRRVREKHETGRDVNDKDVKAEIAKMKARQAELEEQRLQQEEDLREQIGNTDPSEVRARIQFEEMTISKRQTSTVGNNSDVSDRWDERWNGRKNFKRFRKVRRGDAADAQPAIKPRKVIVPLEEARKKDFGLGEDYWLESSSTLRESGRRSGDHVFLTQQSKSQEQSQRGSRSQLNPPSSASQVKQVEDSRTTRSRHVIEEEDSEPEDIELTDNMNPPRSRNRAESTQLSESVASSKRKADPRSSREATSNKRRTTTRSFRGRGDDSSDDDLRFKFKKKV